MSDLGSRGRTAPMKMLLNALLIAVLVSTSFARNFLWRNDITLWTDALMQSPRKIRGRGMNELGTFYVTSHDYDKAVSVLRRSIELNPYQTIVYINLAVAYEGLDLMDQAIRTMRLAITYQPGDPAPYYNLGRIYYDHYKNPDQALPLLEKARDLNQYEPDVHLYLSYIYRDQGDPALAEAEYRRYLLLK